MIKLKEILKSLIFLTLMYFLVHGIALNIGLALMPKISSGEIPPAVQDPEKAETSGEIFLYIILITFVILLLIKFKLGSFIKFLMLLAVFTGMSITLWSFFPDIWFYILIFLYALFILKRRNFIISNGILILTIAGIGGYLGASLHFIPSLLLLLSLSIYDIVAVFFTKHMVAIATKAKDNVPMFSIPVRERFLSIGTGDLAIPSMFVVSILHEFSILHSLFALIGGFIGLLSLFSYILKREKVALPALPPIATGLVVGFLIGFFVLQNSGAWI